MFSKLLKHEWKQSAGLLGILSLGALAAGLLGGFVLKGIIYMSQQYIQEDLMTWGTVGLSSALMFIIVALVAYAFAAQFIPLYRFYKNKFTDEGYLTFTLPVTPRQIFLSSFLNILAWVAISAVVLIVAIGMIILIGAAEPLAELAVDLQPFLWGMLGMVEEGMAGEPGYILYFVLTSLSLIVTPVYSAILLMASITIGCVLAKKHKILAAIGAYYVMNFVVGILESILGVVPLIMLGMAEGSPYAYMNTSTIINLVLRLGLAIGSYFLSVHLMQHKLNLP